MSSNPTDTTSSRGMTATPYDMPENPPIGPDGEPVVQLPPNASQRNVHLGVNYLARVNNVAVYGVFVSLNESYPDVSGLVHKSKLPPLHMPTEFSVDDLVIVQAVGVNEKGLLFQLLERYDGDTLPPLEDDAVNAGLIDVSDKLTAVEYLEVNGFGEGDVESALGERDSIERDAESASPEDRVDEFAELAVDALERFDPMDESCDEGPLTTILATLALCRAKGYSADDVELTTTIEDGKPVLSASVVVPLTTEDAACE